MPVLAFPHLQEARVRCFQLFGFDFEESFRHWLYLLTGKEGEKLDALIELGFKPQVRGTRLPTPEAKAAKSATAVDSGYFLTEAETIVITLAANGLNYKEISEVRGVSISTTKKHIQNVLNKTRSTNQAGAVAKLMRTGCIRKEWIEDPRKIFDELAA